jgi:hypothetical protein
MPSVTPEDFCIAVYCAYTTHQGLVPDGTGRIALTARTVHDDAEDRFEIEFVGVRDYAYTRDPGVSAVGPADLIELSVIELERAGPDWKVWFNPWYLHEFSFRCSRIRINGAEVVGSGRWLQDELPTRRANVPPYSTGAV